MTQQSTTAWPQKTLLRLTLLCSGGQQHRHPEAPENWVNWLPSQQAPLDLPPHCPWLGWWDRHPWGALRTNKMLWISLVRASCEILLTRKPPPDAISLRLARGGMMLNRHGAPTGWVAGLLPQSLTPDKSHWKCKARLLLCQRIIHYILKGGKIKKKKKKIVNYFPDALGE